MFAGSNSLSHLLAEKRVLDAAAIAVNDCSPKKPRVDPEVEQENNKTENDDSGEQEAANTCLQAKLQTFSAQVQVAETITPGSGEDLAPEDRVMDVTVEKKDIEELTQEEKKVVDDAHVETIDVLTSEKTGDKEKSEEGKKEDEKDVEETTKEKVVAKLEALLAESRVKIPLAQHLEEFISSRPAADLNVQTIIDEVNNFHRDLHVPGSHPEQVLALALKKPGSI